MNPIKAELLAPAGDMESLRTALKYGADAIYCGGPFMQLRAASAGFTMESLAEAAERYGDGHLVPTTRLTIEIPGIPYEKTGEFSAFLAERMQRN